MLRTHRIGVIRFWKQDKLCIFRRRRLTPSRKRLTLFSVKPLNLNPIYESYLYAETDMEMDGP